MQIEKEHKKSALMCKTKEELVNLIMTLEHNNNVLHDTLETQADNYIKLTSWVPVVKRLPEESEYIGLSVGRRYMKRLEIAYMTDTIEYTFGYYDGAKWMDKQNSKIENVVAWKLHEPYRPEPGRSRR